MDLGGDTECTRIIGAGPLRGSGPGGDCEMSMRTARSETDAADDDDDDDSAGSRTTADARTMACADTDADAGAGADPEIEIVADTACKAGAVVTATASGDFDFFGGDAFFKGGGCGFHVTTNTSFSSFVFDHTHVRKKKTTTGELRLHTG
jgi:hypothetical protein